MTWQAVKKSLQPVAGEAWYVTNGPDDLHCGTGDEGEDRAQKVLRILNLGGATLPAGQSEYREKLMEHLRRLNDAALNIDPAIVPEVGPGSPLYPLLVGVRTVKSEAVKIQELILNGPSPK